jgi:hypothetical protein
MNSVMGEARRKRQAKANVPECPVEEAPNLQGHIRLTILDDDDSGCSIYVPAAQLTDLLDEISKEKHDGHSLAEVRADTEAWARIRNDAFNLVRDDPA